ncbi:MAG TPA: rod shape-determining protein RodA [Campylobacterales bacterium]|nr:rod shape-determining protein RodA [Campylobacterales bacterium]HHS92412.1 rod shape-determining protein RodA [Campylobacterales bacterium]
MNNWFQFDRRILQQINFLLILQLLPLFAISSYLIHELNVYLFQKQMIYYMVALVMFFVAFLIPWRKYQWLIPLAYWLNLLLLLSVIPFGKVIDGARRWVEIPGIGITLQPSEFIKITVLLMLGYLISRNPPPKDGYGWGMFIKLSIYILIPFLLIAAQPDLGTGLILFLSSAGILFIIGIKMRIWVILLIVVGFSAPLLYTHGLKPYQKQRIANFIGEPSYQVQQSLIAIGSGGMHGQEREDATQAQLKFLPVSSTDFIFAYLGERLGFVGMMVTIGLYIALIIHLILISMNNAKDYFVRVVSAGIAFFFFISMTVNILMTIGLAPVVGLPLPMFSHGGTSFIIFAFLFGILENLLAFRFYFMYNSDSKITMMKKHYSL